jgi:AmiR/NasT family two-component response regulator
VVRTQEESDESRLFHERLGLRGPLEAPAAERERAVNIAGALHTSRHIGTAIGIVMVLEGCGEEEAFALLSTMSQNTNQALAALAEDIVRERRFGRA